MIRDILKHLDGGEQYKFLQNLFMALRVFEPSAIGSRMPAIIQSIMDEVNAKREPITLKGKKLLMETWNSDMNEQEQHFFLKDVYLFGINSKLISDSARSKIFDIIKEDIR